MPLGDGERDPELLRGVLREGGEIEVTQSATLLEEFLRNPALTIPRRPPQSREEQWAPRLFILACVAAGINVSDIIAPLLYDLGENVLYPSVECIAGIVLACQTVARRPVKPEEVFAGAKIRAALASATPRPPSGRYAHNVRQVFGDGCAEGCEFCRELLVVSFDQYSGAAITRLTVPAADLRPIADVLNLSQRTANALARVEIETIFHLRQLTERDLASYKGLGAKIRAEIVEAATNAGIKLGSMANPTAPDVIPMRELQPVPPRRKPEA